MADTFTLDMAKFIAKAGANVEKVVQKTCSGMFAKTVDRTPVGYPPNWKSVLAGGKPPKGYVGGRLRANWNASIGTPDLSVTHAIDKTGAATNARISTKLHGWQGGDIYLMNSLPYVRPIEYGHSITQTPLGMVRITVAEFQTFVNKAVAGLPK